MSIRSIDRPITLNRAEKSGFIQQVEFIDGQVVQHISMRQPNTPRQTFTSKGSETIRWAEASSQLYRMSVSSGEVKELPIDCRKAFAA
ncbi:hypothetical protein PABG_07466 [Paracoccidioides brasiliensis Pb03]|nr:hypothetical protein PABG_07466 [Paracoccidioides brasiliensis Pb03]